MLPKFDVAIIGCRTYDDVESTLSELLVRLKSMNKVVCMYVGDHIATVFFKKTGLPPKAPPALSIVLRVFPDDTSFPVEQYPDSHARVAVNGEDLLCTQ